MRQHLIALFFIGLFSFLLTACGSMAPKKPLPPPDLPSLKDKSLLLYWDQGTVKSAQYHQPTNGIASSILQAVVESRNQNDYRLQYGTEHQAPFMTALRDTFIKDTFFKDVIIMTEPPKSLTKDQVMMVIHFKQTAVTPIEKSQQRFTIKIDTTLYIKDCKDPLFKKDLSVKSEGPGYFDIGNNGQEYYDAVSTDLSNDLIQMVLQSLAEWYKQGHPETTPAPV